jgi:hypothetical protein
MRETIATMDAVKLGIEAGAALLISRSQGTDVRATLSINGTPSPGVGQGGGRGGRGPAWGPRSGRMLLLGDL